MKTLHQINEFYLNRLHMLAPRVCEEAFDEELLATMDLHDEREDKELFRCIGHA